jgi:flagellar biosynthetic protein FlhB
MSKPEDKESKTEEATEKKISDAIEKGNVPFSREAGPFASFVGLLIITSLFMAGGVMDIRVSLQRFIDDPGQWPLENGADAVRLFASVGSDTVGLLLPFVLILAVAGIASSLLQNPPQIVVDRIQPKLSRISLSKGWTRVFGAHGQVEFVKAAFKLGAVALLAIVLMRAAQYDMLNAMFMEPYAIPELMRSMAVRLICAIIVATIVLVAADLVWARIFWQRELRMTRQEVKDEHKQVDGDPIIKARMRSLARDRARKRMMAQVPRATLVITNPTHYAVALRYVREEGGAPLVVAKGQDLIALKIREIATAHGIPLVEDKLLARSLYEKVQVDQLIPPEFYKAVAKIVMYLFLRGKKGVA